MEEIKQESQETMSEKAKRWFQDNLRIIVSVAIVIVIAGGIYSYSKRSETPLTSEQETGEEVALEEDGSVNVEEGTTGEIEGQVAGTQTQQTEKVAAPESRETDNSLIESAARGEGSTHLARRALASYLEKNADSALTKEHKIYIEDYLRKNVGFSGRVHPGTSIEFSKELIKNAIEKSKTLNDSQLRNLQKYSARVTSLT